MACSTDDAGSRRRRHNIYEQGGGEPREWRIVEQRNEPIQNETLLP